MAYQVCPVYNLDAAVGKGAPNKAQDVRLVQNLIQLLAEQKSMAFWLDIQIS